MRFFHADLLTNKKISSREGKIDPIWERLALFLCQFLKGANYQKVNRKSKKDEKNNEEVEARRKGYREVAEKAYEKIKQVALEKQNCSLTQKI